MLPIFFPDSSGFFRVVICKKSIGLFKFKGTSSIVTPPKDIRAFLESDVLFVVLPRKASNDPLRLCLSSYESLFFVSIECGDFYDPRNEKPGVNPLPSLKSIEDACIPKRRVSSSISTSHPKRES